MARVAVLFFSCTSAASDAVLGDGDDAISLLQLSTKRSSPVQISAARDVQETDGLDESELALYDVADDAFDGESDLPNKPKLPILPHDPWGPDGTWNTPYCKDIQGCEPYCVPGCNGAVRWMWAIYGNDRLGVPAGNMQSRLRHFQGCEQGKRLGVGLGRFRGAWMDCFGSENATKAPLVPPEWDSMKENPASQGGFKYPVMALPHRAWSMTPYGHEACPRDCVNDCAFFQYGNFNHCGVTTARGWTGYNRGNGPEVGSNPRCNTDYLWPGQISVYVWCGEPTTTTTPLPPPPDDDEGAAVGDPHLSYGGNHRDVEKSDVHH